MRKKENTGEKQAEQNSKKYLYFGFNLFSFVHFEDTIKYVVNKNNKYEKNLSSRYAINCFSHYYKTYSSKQVI